MDFIRFGYVAAFRFPTADGDRVYRYRFHAAAAHASVASPSMFNSSVWGWPTEPYGEIAGTRQWAPIDFNAPVFVPFPPDPVADGSKPVRIVPKVSVGNLLVEPGCLASAVARGGLPVDVADRGTQAAIAVLTWALYNKTDGEVDAIVAELFGTDAVTHHLTRPSTLFPKAILVRTRAGYLFVSEGTTNEEQLLSEILSSLVPPIGGGTVDGQAAAYAVAMQYYGQVAAILGADTTTPIALAGHSYGGGIADLIAARLVSDGRGKETVSLLTFGAPRAIGSRTRETLNGVRWIAMIASGDPVPSLPPHADVLPWLVPIIGLPLSLVFETYVEAPTSLYVDPSQEWQERTDDAAADDLPKVITDFFVHATLDYPFAAHGIERYVAIVVGPEPEVAPSWIEDYGWWDDLVDEIIGPP